MWFLDATSGEPTTWPPNILAGSMSPTLPDVDARERRQALPVLLACLVVFGCSSARYDADYSRAVAEFRTRAEFSQLRDSPVELLEGLFKLHPPKQLPDQLSESGPDPRFPAGEDGKETKVTARRLRPPFLEGFPGWAAACEGVHGSNATLPASLSISLVPSAELNEKEIESELLARLKKDEAFEAAKLEWQSREVIDRAGEKRTWRVLEAVGPQRIDRFAGRSNSIEESVETAVAIWLSTERGQEFRPLLVWRVPEEIKETVKLAVLAPLVARSLSTAAAAAK